MTKFTPIVYFKVSTYACASHSYIKFRFIFRSFGTTPGVCLQLVVVDGGSADFTLQSQYLYMPPVCFLFY
jgi:hypothetical protein